MATDAKAEMRPVDHHPDVDPVAALERQGVAPDTLSKLENLFDSLDTLAVQGEARLSTDLRATVQFRNDVAVAREQLDERLQAIRNQTGGNASGDL